MDSVWDTLARIHYYRLSERKDTTFHNIFLPVILDTIQKQSNFNTFSVLDVGCGTGYLTGLISNYAKDIFGVDNSQASIDLARRHNNDKDNIVFICEDINKLFDLQQKVFDFAISHLVLHVIENLDLTIENISTCLKIGGGFLFSIPHPRFWALSTDVGTWKFKKVNKYTYNQVSTQQNSISIDGNEFVTPHFHRPIEIYSSVLKKNGFAIEGIIEPFPDKGLLQENHEKKWRYPRFMFVICKKMK